MQETKTEAKPKAEAEAEAKAEATEVKARQVKNRRKLRLTVIYMKRCCSQVMFVKSLVLSSVSNDQERLT